MEGILKLKKRHVFHTWQLNYFVLRNGTFASYASSKPPLASEKAETSLSCAEIREVIWHPNKKNGRRFDVTTESGQVIALQAETKQIALEWVAAIRDVYAKKLPSPTLELESPSPLATPNHHGRFSPPGPRFQANSSLETVPEEHKPRSSDEAQDATHESETAGDNDNDLFEPLQSPIRRRSLVEASHTRKLSAWVNVSKHFNFGASQATQADSSGRVFVTKEGSTNHLVPPSSKPVRRRSLSFDFSASIATIKSFLNRKLFETRRPEHQRALSFSHQLPLSSPRTRNHTPVSPAPNESSSLSPTVHRDSLRVVNMHAFDSKDELPPASSQVCSSSSSALSSSSITSSTLPSSVAVSGSSKLPALVKLCSAFQAMVFVYDEATYNLLQQHRHDRHKDASNTLAASSSMVHHQRQRSMSQPVSPSPRQVLRLKTTTGSSRSKVLSDQDIINEHLFKNNPSLERRIALLLREFPTNISILHYMVRYYTACFRKSAVPVTTSSSASASTATASVSSTASSAVRSSLASAVSSTTAQLSSSSSLASSASASSDEHASTKGRIQMVHSRGASMRKAQKLLGISLEEVEKTQGETTLPASSTGNTSNPVTRPVIMDASSKSSVFSFLFRSSSSVSPAMAEAARVVTSTLVASTSSDSTKSVTAPLPLVTRRCTAPGCTENVTNLVLPSKSSSPFEPMSPSGAATLNAVCRFHRQQAEDRVQARRTLGQILNQCNNGLERALYLILDVSAASADRNKPVWGLALKAFWLLLRHRVFTGTLLKKGVITHEEGLQIVSDKFAAVVRRVCSKHRFSVAARDTLLELLVSEPGEPLGNHGGRNVFFMGKTVQNPGIWQALFTALRYSPLALRKSTMEEVNAILIGQAANCDSLRHRLGWQYYLFPLLTDIHVTTSCKRDSNSNSNSSSNDSSKRNSGSDATSSGTQPHRQSNASPSISTEHRAQRASSTIEPPSARRASTSVVLSASTTSSTASTTSMSASSSSASSASASVAERENPAPDVHSSIAIAIEAMLQRGVYGRDNELVANTGSVVLLNGGTLLTGASQEGAVRTTRGYTMSDLDRASDPRLRLLDEADMQAASNQVYAFVMNVFALVHLHVFLSSTEFECEVNRTLVALKAFGGFGWKTQEMARVLLLSLLKRLTSGDTKNNFTTLDANPAAWRSLQDLHSIIRRFVFQTPYWRDRERSSGSVRTSVEASSAIAASSHAEASEENDSVAASVTAPSFHTPERASARVTSLSNSAPRATSGGKRESLSIKPISQDTDTATLLALGSPLVPRSAGVKPLKDTVLDERRSRSRRASQQRTASSSHSHSGHHSHVNSTLTDASATLTRPTPLKAKPDVSGKGTGTGDKDASEQHEHEHERHVQRIRHARNASLRIPSVFDLARRRSVSERAGVKLDIANTNTTASTGESLAASSDFGLHWRFESVDDRRRSVSAGPPSARDIAHMESNATSSLARASPPPSDPSEYRRRCADVPLLHQMGLMMRSFGLETFEPSLQPYLIKEERDYRTAAVDDAAWYKDALYLVKLLESALVFTEGHVSAFLQEFLHASTSKERHDAIESTQRVLDTKKDKLRARTASTSEMPCVSLPPLAPLASRRSVVNIPPLALPTSNFASVTSTDSQTPSTAPAVSQSGLPASTRRTSEHHAHRHHRRSEVMNVLGSSAQQAAPIRIGCSSSGSSSSSSSGSSSGVSSSRGSVVSTGSGGSRSSVSSCASEGSGSGEKRASTSLLNAVITDLSAKADEENEKQEAEAMHASAHEKSVTGSVAIPNANGQQVVVLVSAQAKVTGDEAEHHGRMPRQPTQLASLALGPRSGSTSAGDEQLQVEDDTVVSPRLTLQIPEHKAECVPTSPTPDKHAAASPPVPHRGRARVRSSSRSPSLSHSRSHSRSNSRSSSRSSSGSRSRSSSRSSSPSPTSTPGVDRNRSSMSPSSNSASSSDTPSRTGTGSESSPQSSSPSIGEHPNSAYVRSLESWVLSRQPPPHAHSQHRTSIASTGTNSRNISSPAPRLALLLTQQEASHGRAGLSRTLPRHLPSTTFVQLGPSDSSKPVQATAATKFVPPISRPLSLHPSSPQPAFPTSSAASSSGSSTANSSKSHPSSPALPSRSGSATLPGTSHGAPPFKLPPKPVSRNSRPSSQTSSQAASPTPAPVAANANQVSVAVETPPPASLLSGFLQTLDS